MKILIVIGPLFRDSDHTKKRPCKQQFQKICMYINFALVHQPATNMMVYLTIYQSLYDLINLFSSLILVLVFTNVFGCDLIFVPVLINPLGHRLR